MPDRLSQIANGEVEATVSEARLMASMLLDVRQQEHAIIFKDFSITVESLEILRGFKSVEAFQDHEFDGSITNRRAEEQKRHSRWVDGLNRVAEDTSRRKRGEHHLGDCGPINGTIRLW